MAARTSPTRTLKSDVLLLRWRDPLAEGGEQCIALFVRDLDDWVGALGGADGPEAS